MCNCLVCGAALEADVELYVCNTCVARLITQNEVNNMFVNDPVTAQDQQAIRDSMVAYNAANAALPKEQQVKPKTTYGWTKGNQDPECWWGSAQGKKPLDLVDGKYHLYAIQVENIVPGSRMDYKKTAKVNEDENTKAGRDNKNYREAIEKANAAYPDASVLDGVLDVNVRGNPGYIPMYPEHSIVEPHRLTVKGSGYQHPPMKASDLLNRVTVICTEPLANWYQPIPNEHPWDNHTSPYKVDDAYRGRPMTVSGIYDDGEGHPVAGKKADGDTMMPYIGMLPKGTTYVVRAMDIGGVTNGLNMADVKGVIATNDDELDADYAKRVQHSMYQLYVHNYRPRLGQSVIRSSRGYGVPLKGVVCEECGGVYKSTQMGEYVCDNCGLVYDEAACAELVDDEESDMDSKSAPEEELGGVHSNAIANIEARSERNITAWKKGLEERPADEQAAKNKVAGKGAATKAANKAVSKNRIKASTDDTDGVYDSKSEERRLKLRKAAILFWLKTQGSMTASELARVMTEHQTPISVRVVLQLTAELSDDGRVSMARKGEHKTAPIVVTYLK